MIIALPGIHHGRHGPAHGGSNWWGWVGGSGRWLCLIRKPLLEGSSVAAVMNIVYWSGHQFVSYRVTGPNFFRRKKKVTKKRSYRATGCLPGAISAKINTELQRNEETKLQSYKIANPSIWPYNLPYLCWRGKLKRNIIYSVGIHIWRSSMLS